jgi:hypothetical protein
MKQLVASRKNDLDWSMQFMDDDHYTTLLNEDVFVTRPDGTPLLVLLKGKVPDQVHEQAFQALSTYKGKTDQRSTASGIKSAARPKKDGGMQRFLRVPKGWDVISGVLGYFERTVRRPYAHPCAWNEKNPERFAACHPLIEFVNATYKKHVPKKWKQQKAIADKTPDWVISGSIFSTITINKNFRTSCHKDAGDLPDGFSCMTVYKKGCKGARLVLPNYEVGVELEHNDLIMFDPHEFHGNTAIIPTAQNYIRMSLVYYYRDMLQYCGSPAQELQYVKNRKQGDPLFPGAK